MLSFLQDMSAADRQAFEAVQSAMVACDKGLLEKSGMSMRRLDDEERVARFGKPKDLFDMQGELF